MGGGRIACGKQLVEPVSGGRAVFGSRDVEANAPQTRGRHTSEGRCDGVATTLEILYPLAHEIGARQVIHGGVSVNAHALIVRLAS